MPRKPEAPVDKLFLERWSPRSYSREEIAEADVLSLFEAARWAPSSMNEQPWTFLYATKSPHLELFRSLLVDSNQAWANAAPVLAFAIARLHFRRNGNPNRHAQFDTGAAWMSLALQARLLGLYAHAMAGIHVDRAHEELRVPREKFEILCAFAIGRRGDPEALPPAMREREAPNERRGLVEIAREGVFPEELLY